MKKNVTVTKHVFSMALFFLLSANSGYAQSYFAGVSSGTGNTSASATGVGYRVLSSSNSGSSVTGFGFRALESNTTGSGSTAVGSSSLGNNTTGIYNSAVGYTSLQANTTGYFNCALGSQALYSNISGYNNVALGRISMLSHKVGFGNVAVGSGSLQQNDSSNFNTASGYEAMRSKLLGDSNVSVGVSSGATYNLYRRCTFVGATSDATSTGLVNAGAFGAGAKVDASNKVVIGNTAVTSIGGWANWTNFSDRRLKKNINKSKLGLDFILSLNPVTYNYIVEGQQDILQTGLIAQDVDEAAKKAGVDFSGVDKSGEYWGIRYATLTVPLIKAVQEMENKHQTEAALLNNRIEKLEAIIVQLQQGQKAVIVPAEKSFLFQNQPNPFNSATTIRYMLSGTDKNALLVIRDLNGRALKQISLVPGKGNITINAGEMQAGTYTYSLLVNGECADTKLMVLVK